MTNGFERRREQSKEEIRKAAWELFGQFGVERVTIADIAAKARVSQATIYNNFESKDALAREFVTSVVEGLIARIEQVLMPERPFSEKMTAFTGCISQMIAGGGPSDAGAAIFAGSADLIRDPEIREIREAAGKRMTGLLLRLVAEGKQQGQVDPALSDDALAAYFRAFMDVFVDPQLHRQFASRRGLIDEIASLMIYGLRGPGAGRAT